MIFPDKYLEEYRDKLRTDLNKLFDNGIGKAIEHGDDFTYVSVPHCYEPVLDKVKSYYEVAGGYSFEMMSAEAECNVWRISWKYGRKVIRL